MRAMTIVIAATVLWLGGCAQDAALDAGEGVLPEELLDDIAVNRIGRD